MMSETNIAGTLAVAASASFAASLLIVLTQEWHGKLSLDGDINGIQKFHKTPVPRVGGVALLIGMLAAYFFGVFSFEYPAAELMDTSSVAMLLFAAVPAFAAGLMEDMTKRISAQSRLLATIASALLACWLLDAILTRLDVWGGDALLQFSPAAAVIITAIAVAGVANSINIIDGFHGVAGSAVVIMLAGMGFLAWKADDVFITNLALMGIGATVGFLLINYPTGRLFMGDGGAYFLGFWVAEVAVLLVVRNSGINTWQVLLICAYPVIEVLYSIYRRKVIRKSSPGAPDRLHLHTLIYRRVICQVLPRNDNMPWIRNAVVACVISSWIAATTLAAILFGDTIAVAVPMLMVDIMLYIAVYTRLVRGHWRMNPFVPAAVSRSRTVVRELP